MSVATAPPTASAASGVYRRHRSETTALYEVVRDNLETLYVERVLPPQSGLRQWVLTFPFSWRRRLAQDGALLGRLTRASSWRRCWPSTPVARLRRVPSGSHTSAA